MRIQKALFLPMVFALSCTAIPTAAAVAQSPSVAAAKAKPGKTVRAKELSARKIIDGVPVPPGLLPFQVSLFRALDGHFCGGSLIDAQWVLTAAHCIVWMDDTKGFHVLAGTNNLLDGGVVLAVEKVIVHPQYDDESSANDIALVKIVHAQPRNEGNVRTISPFALNDTQSRQLTGPAIVSGYGTTEEDGDLSPQLMMADVPLVSTAVCNAPESYNGDIVESMMCAGGSTKDSCQGDSGGPLVAGDPRRGFTLLGVVSWGDGCARPMKYGVYTRVASFGDWIRSTMAQ